jgi:hypothetical protein
MGEIKGIILLFAVVITVIIMDKLIERLFK